MTAAIKSPRGGTATVETNTRQIRAYKPSAEYIKMRKRMLKQEQIIEKGSMLEVRDRRIFQTYYCQQIVHPYLMFCIAKHIYAQNNGKIPADSPRTPTRVVNRRTIKRSGPEPIHGIVGRKRPQVPVLPHTVIRSATVHVPSRPGETA